jgi:hypothetical protein
MNNRWLVGVAAIAAVAGLAQAGFAQGKKAAPPRASGGPVATYWLSADTVSGMSAMGGMAGMAAMAGGGSGGAMADAAPRPPSAGQIIGGLLGRGGMFGRKSRKSQAPAGGQAPAAVPSEPLVHQLFLQLGSRTRPTAAPSAEHLVPPALQAGASLPLVTPETAPTGPMGQFERPKGKILFYWGCGERARAGQPVTIDFSRLAAGQMPPGMGNAMQVRTEQGPSLGRYPGYGEWPNKRETRQLPATSSLVGNHVVRGNYSPEIPFSLAPGQDFMAPLRLTENTPMASGAVSLRWAAVPGATGYHAWVSGATPDGTLVMWSSSESQMFGMAADYLAPGEAARLVQSRVLMSPATSQCAVPAEVQRSVQGAMLMMTAYGPETNLAQPKPAGAPVSWRPEWTVKLRTKATNSGMLGMDMAAMMRGR